jgi:hypothetical protein
MAMHILHDLALKNAVNPCGFCLDTGGLCSIRLVKGRGRKGAKVVDIQNSRCRNIVKLSVNSAAKSTQTNPCTNYPIECPYCREGSDPIWKYNLLVHFLTVHPTADHNQHKELYTIGMEERAHLKTLYHTKPRHSKKKKQVMDIKISEAHSTRHALR